MQETGKESQMTSAMHPGLLFNQFPQDDLMPPTGTRKYCQPRRPLGHAIEGPGVTALAADGLS